MGIRFCRQRRPIPAEPEPEDDPVTDPSVSSEGHSSADSQVEEQTVEATAVDPGVVVGAPVTLDLPRDSENFRLTLGPPNTNQSAESGYRFYAVWVIPKSGQSTALCWSALGTRHLCLRWDFDLKQRRFHWNPLEAGLVTGQSSNPLQSRGWSARIGWPTSHLFPMAIQTGSTAWISLADSFESPRWREVAIVEKMGMVASGCEGQKTSRNTGSVDSSRVRLEDLLSCGDQSSSAAHVWSRAEFAAECGSCRPSQESERGAGLRCRDHFCISHGARKRGPWTQTKDFETSEGQFNKFKQFRHGGGRPLRCSEKELARRGYRWRRAKKAFIGSGQWQESLSLTGSSGEGDHKELRRAGLGKSAEPSEGRKRPRSKFAGITPRGEFERQAEKGEKQPQPGQEHQCKLKQFRRSRQLWIGASSKEGTCEGGGNVPKLETSHVSQTSEIHKKVCEGGGTGFGGGEPPLSPLRDWKEDRLGEAKEPAEMSLHAVRHPDEVAEGPDRKSNAPNSVVPSVGSSSSPGRRLEHCLASDTSSGSLDSQAVGWGSGRFGKCDCIPEEHGRSQQECRQDPSIQRCSGSETAESLPGGKARDKKGKGKGKDKKEEDRAES